MTRFDILYYSIPTIKLFSTQQNLIDDKAVRKHVNKKNTRQKLKKLPDKLMGQ